MPGGDVGALGLSTGSCWVRVALAVRLAEGSALSIHLQTSRGYQPALSQHTAQVAGSELTVGLVVARGHLGSCRPQLCSQPLPTSAASPQ